MARSRKRKVGKKQQQLVPLRRSLRIKNLSCSNHKSQPSSTSKPLICCSNKVRAVAEDTVSCSICLDTSRCHVMKTLACKHTFHSRCVTRCLEKNPHCPLCRAPCYLKSRSNKRLRDDIHDSIMNNMILYAFMLLDQ